MSELRGKVALITGAGRGSGAALAEAFAVEGVIVAANDITPVNVDEVVARIKAAGGQAEAYIHDISRKAAVQAMLKEVEDRWGRIDVLVNHASVRPSGALLDMDEWDWHRVLDVNLTGAFLLIQSVGRMMRAQGDGVIVTLGAGPGLTSGPGAGAYQASMGGLQSLSREAADELSAAGVRFHLVERNRGNLVETVIELCKM